jgi:cellobiose phosphorylase
MRDAGRLLESRYGYFTPDGREYVITDPRTPKPWVNVISNGDWSLLVSQTGGGYSWRDNAGQNRITRAFQDLVKDGWGTWLYLRDLDSGAFWSATWKPVTAPLDTYEVRHGIGYSVFSRTTHGIASVLRRFAVPGAPVEVFELALENTGRSARRLDVTSWLEWVLGNFPDEHREFKKLFIDSRWDASTGALLVDKHLWDFPDEKGRHNNVSWPFTAFHAAWPAPDGYDGDKESFLGMYGDEADPAALRVERLAGRVGRFTDAGAALRVRVDLAAGERRTVVFTLGAAAHGSEDAVALARRWTSPAAAAEAFAEVGRSWSELLDAEHVETPEPALDVMVNGWLKYQAVSCRLWGKSGAYQVSAGLGFRDQLQDSLVYLPLRPELARRQIVRHAAQQFQEGDVKHWWLTIREWGPRTKCSDDLLWLPLAVQAWIAETADASILDEVVPFADGGSASIYEHCRRSIERAFHRFSPRGVPLMGDMDWNDGLSAVGTDWKGESFWVGEFLYYILADFIPLARSRGDAAFAEKCSQVREALREAVNRHGWDGAWYLQATTDDGLPLGSRENDEGKIFLNPQVWAVISGIAPADRAGAAMASVTEHLLAQHGALLLAPAYTRIRTDVGYVTRYAPGLRENGGVYTHAATWAAWAYALLGDAPHAWEALRRLLPPTRAADIDRYQAEPYVVPGNTDGPISPLFGRGGWTWYTGSAQWLHRVATHWILGVRPAPGGLLLDPCIPAAWDGFSVRRRFRGATYDIRVDNRSGAGRGVRRLSVDGRAVAIGTGGALVGDLRDGGVHRVEAVLG